MDKYICLKKSDVVIPAEEEEESSSDDEDGDEDEDDEDEDEDEDEEGLDDDPPETPKQESEKVVVEVREEGENVSDCINDGDKGLIGGTGSTCASNSVFGRVEGQYSISGRHDKYSASRRDLSDVLCQIS